MANIASQVSQSQELIPQLITQMQKMQAMMNQMQFQLTNNNFPVPPTLYTPTDYTPPLPPRLINLHLPINSTIISTSSSSPDGWEEVEDVDVGGVVDLDEDEDVEDGVLIVTWPIVGHMEIFITVVENAAILLMVINRQLPFRII